MFRLNVLTFVVGLAKVSPAAFHSPQALAASAEGKVTGVTLYRGQALVTRAGPVEGNPGSIEIVVGKLPEQIVPNSLFAEGGDAIEIRAVRFRTRAVGEQPRERILQALADKRI